LRGHKKGVGRQNKRTAARSGPTQADDPEKKRTEENSKALRRKIKKRTMRERTDAI